MNTYYRYLKVLFSFEAENRISPGVVYVNHVFPFDELDLSVVKRHIEFEWEMIGYTKGNIDSIKIVNYTPV